MNASTGSASAAARAAAARLWEAQHAHPFVCGIGDGTLPLEAFGFWVRQDYVFLKDYVRVLALGAARAPGLAAVARFAQLAHETASTEMTLHRTYAARFGIDAAALEAEDAAPATAAYTDFLLRTATLGSYAELLAALLPCMWGFSEIGQRLAAADAQPADDRYAAWIDMYASDDFAALAAWCRSEYDAAVGEAGAAERARATAAFVASSRHELAFWDAAWAARRDAAHDTRPGASPARARA
jgi:thiaminase/transcriptional activator TenA